MIIAKTNLRSFAVRFVGKYEKDIIEKLKDSVFEGEAIIEAAAEKAVNSFFNNHKSDTIIPAVVGYFKEGNISVIPDDKIKITEHYVTIEDISIRKAIFAAIEAAVRKKLNLQSVISQGNGSDCTTGTAADRLVGAGTTRSR